VTATDRRLLGVDVGERRIGVAVSQGRIAVPLTIFEHETRASDLERVAAAARDQGAAAIVVGLPLHMSGDEGEQARRSRRFGDALARRAGVPVVYQDERYSTAAVASAAGGRIENARGAKRRGKPRMDDLAAAVILQAYIDAQEAAE
jgi:putative Holliday junction resolvase